MSAYSHITSKCFVNAPYAQLETGLLELILGNRLQPEIGLEGDVLYTRTLADFTQTAQILKDNSLSCTLHAPFLDLAPGATDKFIRTATREKLRKAFELIPIFQPKSIVCHLGYEHDKHHFKEDEWFGLALETWQELVDHAANHQTPVMLENTFEKTPAQHRKIFEALDSPYARFCLDVGHVMSFAKNTWQDWLPELAPWLGQLHLHDNDGISDRHLGIGKGVFDFKGLFVFIQENNLLPIITLEPHEEAGLWESLEALERMEFFT
ncbi:MAG: sugar phosphate isomerase/epimerase [Proteobacteria bacterium]|nr:sugar phosphate isomerase/epimerase [Pseudomonadota bacterium]